MGEYIEREKVKDELRSWAVCINHPEHLLKEDALCVIDSIPAADVEPVKHGRWVFDGQDHFCDRCNRNALCDKMTGEEVLSVVCPSCGAKMDKEDSDG